ADEDAVFVGDEQAVDVEVAHLLDDTPGGGVQSDAEDGGGHQVADGGGVDPLDLELVPPRPGQGSPVLDLGGRDVLDLFAVVDEDVGLGQHADRPAGLVDDGGSADVAINEEGHGLVEGRVGSERHGIGTHQVGSGPGTEHHVGRTARYRVHGFPLRVDVLGNS